MSKLEAKALNGDSKPKKTKTEPEAANKYEVLTNKKRKITDSQEDSG